MNERLRRLQAQRGKAIADARAILDQADGEKRGLTPEEEERYTRLDEEYDKLTHAIEQEGRLAQREKEAHESFNGLDNPQQRRQPGQALEGSAPNDGPEYRKAMLGYLVSGRMDGLMLDGIDEKRTILGIGLSGGSSGGSVLAPVQLERTLLDDISKNNVVRTLADVRQSASNIDIPYVTAHTKAYLIAEGADFTASTPTFGKVSMKAYKVGALTYITVEAMQDVFLDMEAWMRDDFARAFAELEEEHFIQGSGVSQPEGVLTGGSQGLEAAGSTALTADEIIDLVYSVNSKYRTNGKFLMHDSTIKLLRKLKDSDGRYLWQPSIKDGEPDRLFGYPLYTSDTMPQASAGNKAVVFGDFKKLRILDRRGLYIQRLSEIAATSGQVAFLAYRRYDSKVLDAQALKYITMKATQSAG